MESFRNSLRNITSFIWSHLIWILVTLFFFFFFLEKLTKWLVGRIPDLGIAFDPEAHHISPFPHILYLLHI